MSALREEGQSVAAAGPQDQTQKHSADFATADEWRAAVAKHDKDTSTLIAKFAMAGWCLYVTETCGRVSYVVTRWGQVREFDSLAEVEAFARQVGVQI
jgi:hypothetical protein